MGNCRFKYLLLIHNETIEYEVRYEIMRLTEESKIRKQIGGRINQNDTMGNAEEWIEVFVPRPE